MGRSNENQSRLEWTDVVESVRALSGRIWWLNRFRLQYYLDVNYQISLDGGIRYFLRCTAGLVYHTWGILLAVIRLQKGPSLSPAGLVFLLTDNIVYLMHLLPILREAGTLAKDPMVLVRSSHRRTVEKMLSEDSCFAGVKVFTYNELARGIPLRQRLVLLLTSVGGFLKDLAVWLRSGMSTKWLILARFMTFSLVNRFYSSIVSWNLQNAAAVVSANDHSMWESMIFAEADPHTETFLVQHGVLPRFIWPASARKVLVWGEYHRTFMIDEMNAPPEAVIVMGAPGYDQLLFKLRNRPQKEKNTICFLSQFHGTPLMGPEGYDRAVEMFCQLADNSSESGLRFVIKLHPSDDDKSIKSYEERYIGSVVITREDLIHVLDRTILAILVDSTALFEAVLMDIPVVQLEPKGLLRFADFSTEGLTILCHDQEELTDAFLKIVQGGEASSQIHEAMRKARSLYLANIGNAVRASVRIILGGKAGKGL